MALSGRRSDWMSAGYFRRGGVQVEVFVILRLKWKSGEVLAGVWISIRYEWFIVMPQRHIQNLFVLSSLLRDIWTKIIFNKRWCTVTHRRHGKAQFCKLTNELQHQSRAMYGVIALHLFTDNINLANYSDCDNGWTSISLV
jgi:hypothetical protein